MNELNNIKRIINTFGSFSVSDIESTSSPVVNTMGKDVSQLAERFYNDGVDVITYIHSTVTDEDFVEYENLSDDVIKEINNLAMIFEEMCIKEEI